MLLHMDGSQHRWFQDERQLDRIVILDDATSEIDDAQLVDQGILARSWQPSDTSWKRRDGSRACIAIVPAISSAHRKPEGRSIDESGPKWDAP